jgi:hypothetical protein
MDQQEYYKYGYYSVGNRITRSKIEAIEWCQIHNGWPTFHFHDDDFSSYDWKQEPAESIETLYQARAKELREKYDYLVVMYSGGVDSHNMLMSFLSQGIVPDEIAYFYHSHSKDDNVMNVEWNVQTLPRLKVILEKWPSIKLRRIDMSDMLVDYMHKFIDDIPYVSTNMAANHPMRSLFNTLIKDWADLKIQGKSLRILYGVDKPRLRFDGTSYIFNFYDTSRNGATDRSESDDQEWFYWTPKSPKISIKQSHIVRRFWQHNKDRWADLKCTYNKNLGWLFDRENSEAIRLVYPYCTDEVFLTWRPNNDYYGNRDSEVILANSDITKKYVDMCESLSKRIDPMYFNQGHVKNGYVGSVSKNYYID